MKNVEPHRGDRRIASVVLAMVLVVLMVVSVYAAYTAIYPSASGSNTYKSGGATLDAGNAADGYVMISMKSAKKLKVRIAGEREYTYDLRGDGNFDVYPLQDGSRTYKIHVFEQVRGTSYSQVLSKSVEARLNTEYAAFLCPNRYSMYDSNGAAVALSAQLCQGLSTDLEKAQAVYRYVSDNILYDYVKALTVKSGYVPDVEETLRTSTGICFDYAALICAMLRSQGIPTKLVMGYADTSYHAWNSVLIDGEWLRLDATAKATSTDIREYTEEAEY